MTPTIGPAATRVRFLVLAFGVALAAVTYLDRVCISVTAKQIMRDLSLTELQMSFVFSAFTLAYAIFEIPTGYWGDRIGTRKVLTRIVVWWSSFTVLTSFAFSYPTLLAVRFLFGAGEAGAWPNVARTFSRWFPASERGTAQGIFFMGAHLAGGLTPLLVAALLVHLHWRAVFVVFGLVGFVWSAAWYYWFRDEPSKHPRVNAAEVRKIEGGRRIEAAHSIRAADFLRLFRSRNIIGLCLSYFTQSYGFYFYITWLPTYLEKARGFTSVKLGILAGLPLMLSVLADLVGGVATDYASRRFGLRWGRAGVGVVSCLGAGLAMLAGAFVEDGVSAAILIAIAAASSNLMLGASWGSCIDIGGNQTGLIGGVMNTSGQVGGILSPIILALIVRHFSSWSAPLYLTGLLYTLGALAWCMVDASKPLWPRTAREEAS
ncbi:MAG TPA: MFS transporter [Bryobacteraceae bacterium]|jgi:MFS family permease|nr:MFS transporter [Bryobacteraceae bacterium]